MSEGGSLSRRKAVSLSRGLTTAALCTVMVNLAPAWSDDVPSLDDLIKGKAPSIPLQQNSDIALPAVQMPDQTMPVIPTQPAQPTPQLQGETQDHAPLQGQVDAADAVPAPSSPRFKSMDAMPAPVMKKKPLEASVQTQQLNSAADQDDDDLKGQNALMDKNKRLNGNANDLNNGLNSQDPDTDDQEMMIEWDKWHNRVLNAIQQGLIEQLQSTGDNVMLYDPRTGRMRSKYPLGTMAMFSCQVTPAHKVINLKIDQPSGYPDYDRAVYQAVKVLDGSSILRYPKGSRRKVVFEAAGIRTSMQSGPANFHWGDTERYRIPGN